MPSRFTAPRSRGPIRSTPRRDADGPEDGGEHVEARGDGRKRLGARGEDAAAAHLEALGYEILARNWRSRLGELDLVARDGTVVVFVEVKLRYDPVDPLHAVDSRKQHKLSQLAFDFLARHGMLAAQARFDVVAVEGRTLACTVVRDAFDSTLDY
jgi:putative endonuclease